MNKIDLIDRNSGLKYNMKKIESFCMDILSKIGVDGWEFSILFCDDNYIEDINKEFRHKEGPTDVLTFCEKDSDWNIDIENDYYYAGDMIISIDSLEKNSEYFAVDPSEELKRLIVHGILHFNGMDHESNNPEEEMLVLQENILQDFGDYKI